MLSPPELKLLHPRRRLAAFVPPTPAELTQQDGDGKEERGKEEQGKGKGKAIWGGMAEAEGIGRGGMQAGSKSAFRPGSGSGPESKSRSVSATYIWADLVRVDVVSGPPTTSLAFYGPNSMQVYSLPFMQVGAGLHGCGEKLRWPWLVWGGGLGGPPLPLPCGPYH